MVNDQVTLFHFWPNVLGLRLKVALAEKGIEYEHKEEGLYERSPLLPQMNPIYKKFPVLIHNGKPVYESLNALQYIDEAWHDRSPLMPSDPYERAQARFLAEYVDKKMYPAGRLLVQAKGEELERGKKEVMEVLKKLEGELKDKAFFGGDKMGFVDVAVISFSCWFYAFETIGNFSIRSKCPKIIAWAKRCLEKESVSKSLPDSKKVCEFALEFRKSLEV